MEVNPPPTSPSPPRPVAYLSQHHQISDAASIPDEPHDSGGSDDEATGHPHSGKYGAVAEAAPDTAEAAPGGVGEGGRGSVAEALPGGIGEGGGGGADPRKPRKPRAKATAMKRPKGHHDGRGHGAPVSPPHMEQFLDPHWGHVGPATRHATRRKPSAGDRRRGRVAETGRGRAATMKGDSVSPKEPSDIEENFRGRIGSQDDEALYYFSIRVSTELVARRSILAALAATKFSTSR
jgi:hypothetical protein